MLARSSLMPYLLAACMTLGGSAALAQNSAFSLWDQMVDHPDFSEAELLGLALYVKAELSLFDFHLELCQREQPESEEAFADLDARFDTIAAPLLEFLARYSDEELDNLGVPNDGRYQAGVDQERAILAREFPGLDDDWQKNTCSDLRASVRNMEPLAPVTRF